MALGGRGGGAKRIGAGVGGLVGQRRVIDAVMVALQRDEGRRSDRADGIAGNRCAVDRRHNDLGNERRAGSQAGGGGERLDVFEPAAQGEARPRARRPDEADQERRRGVGGEREFGQRARRLAGVEQIGAVGDIRVDQRLAARLGGRRRGECFG